ncbi:MAG: AraC family transcriptional regulator [Steroidobacteraceae bacterium]
MKSPPWTRVRRDVGRRPFVEGAVDGDCPVYVERWVYQATQVDVGGIGCPVLITQLGGPRVHEGRRDRWRMSTLPSQSVLVPRDTPTSWHYTGPVDDVVFYLLAPDRGVQRRLAETLGAAGRPLPFVDELVAAAARQVADELQGNRADEDGFLGQLVSVMLVQALRVLDGANAKRIQPRHAHFARLQKVLRHVHAHLAQPLTNDRLAELAGVSESHFRRIFLDAVGMAPHQYVLQRRLVQARTLLATTELPISVVAGECGFNGQSHLTRSFRSAFAATPADYRRRMQPPRS